MNERTEDPRDIIDKIMVRLELVERNVSEMAASERSRGKMVAVLTLTEEIRDYLRELRSLCGEVRPAQQPCQP